MSHHIIHTEDGRLAADTPFPHVQEMVNAAVDSGHVVFHFHGGLVNEDKGREIAQRLTPVYQQAGGYPIFAVWEAGLIETFTNNLKQVSTEQTFRKILKRVLRIVRRKFVQDEGGRSGGTLPAIDFTDFEDELDLALNSDDPTDLPPGPPRDADLSELSEAEAQTLVAELQGDANLAPLASSLSQGLRDRGVIEAEEATRSSDPVVASEGTLMDSASLERMIERPDPTARGIVSTIKLIKAIVAVAARVIRRFIKDRDHGFHATVIEEILREFYIANIGGLVWKEMKKTTADSFGSDHREFGGTAVLKVLNDKIRAGASPRITLIGHSTGAVYIAHFLKEANVLLPESVKFDIVFLASACTFNLASDMILPLTSRIRGLRMFAMKNSNEKKDRLVPVLYPHSLLYFVSGVVEEEVDMPLVGMQRFYDEDQFEPDKFPKVEAFRQFMAAPRRACWSKAVGTGAGLETESLKHGDFDNEPKTLLSVQEIISNGL